MSTRILLSPLELSGSEIYSYVSKPFIFLAGPIQGAPDWNSEACSLLFDSNAVVMSPRRNHMEDFVYEKQVEWESKYLNRAARYGVIIFWLAKEKTPVPGRSYAQTTRFELAEWITKYQFSKTIREKGVPFVDVNRMLEVPNEINLVIGIEDGFTGDRYIRKRLADECPEITIYSTLEDVCAKASEITNQMEYNKWNTV